MKRMRIVWLCLLASFALTAIAASSASAAKPEFIAKKFPVTFTSTSGKGTLETLGGTQVTCSSDTDTGELTGANGGKDIANVVVKFNGCKESVFNAECKTSGAAAGEIKTNVLSGEVGYIKKAAPIEVGLMLSPTTAALFAEFNCLGGLVKIQVQNLVEGKALPLNKSETKGELIYKQKLGMQELNKLEGQTGESLLETSIGGGAFEGSGIETTDKITFAEPVELSA
jgi:hypothetical protein